MIYHNTQIDETILLDPYTKLTVGDLLTEIQSLQGQLRYSEKQVSLAQAEIMRLNGLLENKGE